MWLSVAFFVGWENGLAAEKHTQKPWQKTCDRVKNVPYPPGDLPTANEAKALKDCSSYNLYYGFTGEADPVKARLCAYKERKDSGDDPFFGAAMLMTIYANGVGAKRNFDLALKLACEIDGAPAEMEGRIKHLEDLKAQNWQGTNFSLCDDITSGYMQGFCANHLEKFESAKREKKLGSIQTKWTKSDKNEFKALSNAAYSYFDIHVENEVEQSGTAHTAMYINDKAAQEDAFIKTLDGLEKKSLPKYTVEQFREADAELNRSYKTIQKNFKPEHGTVTKEGIKITQRAWVKYKEAFLKFCSKKYPGTEDSLKTHLTLKRLEELKEFLAE
jgi:uncharacterized protein YecT (DUF1311 family)